MDHLLTRVLRDTGAHPWQTNSRWFIHGHVIGQGFQLRIKEGQRIQDPLLPAERSGRFAESLSINPDNVETHLKVETCHLGVLLHNGIRGFS